MPYTVPKNSERYSMGSYIISQLSKYLTVARFLSIPGIPSNSLSVVENHSGGAFTATPNLTVPVPTISLAVPVPTAPAVDGAVAHIESPLTELDETTAANNGTANDMHLSGNAATPAVTDGYILGSVALFDGATINVGTAGIGTYVYTYKVWTGSAWTAVTINFDTINNFKTAGKVAVNFVRNGSWTLKTIAGLNLYWLKFEITSYTSMTTKPLGTQAWINVLT